MRPDPRLAVSLAAVLLAGCTPADADSEGEPPAPPTTLEGVVDRHVAAMGGRAALDALRNVDVRFEVTEPTFTVEGRYRAARDGRVRVDVSAGGRTVFREGIDAAGAWQQAGPDAPVTAASDAGEAALRHGVEYNLIGLHRFPERGHELVLEGSETIDGVDHRVIRVTLRDGFTTRLYLDPGSWLVRRRRDVRALHPDLDAEERPLETVYTSYGSRCGVRRPIRSVQLDLATGDTVQSSRTLEQICNVPESALELSRPRSGASFFAPRRE